MRLRAAVGAAPMYILGEPRPEVPATALERLLLARNPSRWNVGACAGPTNEGRQRGR
jgi:hypothetical protein